MSRKRGPRRRARRKGRQIMSERSTDMSGAFRLALDEVIKGLPRVPRVATLIVTLHCNSRCYYCTFGRSDNTAKELEEAEVIRALDQIEEAGIREVCLTGGEPLTWKPLSNIVANISRRGMNVTLLTNGSLLSRTKLWELTDNGVRMIVLSLDSLDPEVYRRHRGIPLTKPLMALDLLREERERVPGFNFIVTSVLTVESIHGAPEFAREMGERGVMVQFQPLHTDQRLLTHHDEGVIRAAERICSLVVPGGAVVNHPKYLRHIPTFFQTGRPPDGFPCLAGYLYLLIDMDFDVRICNRMPPLGNLNRDRLCDLLASPQASETRKQMVDLRCPGCWLLCSGQPALERLEPFLINIPDSAPPVREKGAL